MTVTLFLGLSLLVSISSVAAFAPHSQAITRWSRPRSPDDPLVRRQSCRLHMSMQPFYDEISQNIIARLGLKRTEYTDSYGTANWSANNGMSGTASWYDEQSPQFLTGVTMATCNDDCMLNIWIGPSYDVPHVLCNFGQQQDGTYYAQLDYIVRGATPLGSDPQYVQQYYGAEVQQAWNQAMLQSGGFPGLPTLEFDLRLLHSPVRINVRGLGDAAMTAAMVRSHIDRALTWLDAAPPVPARSRGAYNMRDDKLRQFFFRGQVQKQTNMLGGNADLGQAVAAANTGPIAEAYVGGGS